VTNTETERRRKPGRPRKYGQGRINATVRFTPERYAALKTEADRTGRSLSEQVEAVVEQAATVHELRATNYTLGSGGNEEVAGQINALKEAIARIETLLKQALRRRKPK
jgi:hypothetical protein